MDGTSQFLHGTLEVTIFHATPYQPSSPCMCLGSKGRPTYVSIKINQQTVARTSYERDRIWNQTFQILCAHPPDSLITIAMKMKCFTLGQLHFTAKQLLNGARFHNGFFHLNLEDGKPIPNLQLQLILWYRPVHYETSWLRQIKDGNFRGLESASFPQRTNCSVTIYHDAHHSSTFKSPLDLSGGPRKLWEDVYTAIEGAKHVIYIAGWSLNPKMVLVRDPETELPHARGVRLGHLLKQKAEEGVAVWIMLWDDETSLPLIKNKGLMRTHDEDSVAYFRNTKVVCRLCPRLHKSFPTIFSHHQKTITVDAQVRDSPGSREIMSFIGGVDLCDGRYDTEEHSLFQTLNTEAHSLDFYQTSIAGASLQKGGPREPWHDGHACIRGAAAMDILTNFEQRWTKQCDKSLLLPASTKSSLFLPEGTPAGKDANWSVQVFRSIDCSSVSHTGEFFREESIHNAYVQAIRGAESFIYIENQYFIGGCDMWERDRHCGCRNLIPTEIAMKIVKKIRARERFAVYVVIPMWPEGVPESQCVQDILFWTRETMKMMYNMIGKALQETGGEGHPRDYLNFFCLANREEEQVGEFIPMDSPHPTTLYWNAQKNRRFMIYVHSKLMIVDDIYMIMGSANVNQRSMDGGRDTEIVIGCYQPNSSQNKQNGYIHAHRMGLWYEHTRSADELYHRPESIECVRRLQSTGQKMWNTYTSEEVVDMKGVHLVCYPVTISKDGSLRDLDSIDHFPDTTAPIKGKRSKILPPLFTT
ncbi:hypothetical protein Droror1_Dr00009848 [Drosera rotundifolia]